jgi:hypothetical protein
MSLIRESSLADAFRMRPAYFLASSIALAALTSCTQEKKLDPNVAALTAVSTATGGGFKAALHNNVKLFQSGPQQLTGPDAVLEKGTVVRLVRQQFGYSLVQTVSSNQLGWVANDDLGPVDAPNSTGDVFGPYGITTDGNIEAEVLPAPPDSSRDTAVVGRYKVADPDSALPPSKKHSPAVETRPSPQPNP